MKRISTPTLSRQKKRSSKARMLGSTKLAIWDGGCRRAILSSWDVMIFQVKLRGHRIELGEIEHTLSTYEGVQNSVVLLKTPQAENRMAPPYLIGYYVSPE